MGDEPVSKGAQSNRAEEENSGTCAISAEDFIRDPATYEGANNSGNFEGGESGDRTVEASAVNVVEIHGRPAEDPVAENVDKDVGQS